MRTINTLVLGAALAAASIAFASSGLRPGEQVTPFHPKHVAGPLAGSDKCFPCTFQSRPQVQVWVNGDAHENVLAIAKALDASMAKHQGKEFKALVVVLTDKANADSQAEMVKKVAASAGLKHVAVALLDKGNDAVDAYKIDLKAKNTVIAYRDWKVTGNASNVSGKSGLATIEGLVAQVVK